MTYYTPQELIDAIVAKSNRRGARAGGWLWRVARRDSGEIDKARVQVAQPSPLLAQSATL